MNMSVVLYLYKIHSENKLLPILNWRIYEKEARISVMSGCELLNVGVGSI